MDKNEIEKKLSFADHHLGPISNYFTDKFSVVKGNLEKIGSMESRTSVTTNSSDSVVGQIGDKGGFGAIKSSNSTSNVNVHNSINLLKIGSRTFTDVGIPNSGFFDAIEIGDDIGVVMNAEERRIMFISDHTQGTVMGVKPDCSADKYKWVALAVTLFFLWLTLNELYNAITNLYFPSLIIPLITVASFILYRATSIGSTETKANWHRAVNQAESY